ncbi:MAG: YfiR family protein [Acidobacteriota bacterium]
MKNRCCKKRTAFFIFLSLAFVFAVSGEANRESKIKAVFIYNFTKYIYWSNVNISESFKIGVYGAEDIIKPLRSIAKKRSVSGKKIEVKHFKKLEDIDYCHIMFITDSKSSYSGEIIKKFRDKMVLFIGENDNFAENGGSIGLLRDKEKLKIEINKNAINRSGLKISSQLLDLAILVKDKNGNS